MIATGTQHNRAHAHAINNTNATKKELQNTYEQKKISSHMQPPHTHTMEKGKIQFAHYETKVLPYNVYLYQNLLIFKSKRNLHRDEKCIRNRNNYDYDVRYFPIKYLSS